MNTEEGPVSVDAGEVIRFAPGEFQTGYNASDERVVAFALGAPSAVHDWDQIETTVECRACDAETGHGLELTESGGFRLICTVCETAFTIDR